MADPVTSNIALAIPLRGSNVGVWDLPVDGDFNSIDGFIGGVQTISASNANITLTAPAGSITPSGGPTQAQNAVLRFTGVLTAGVQVTLPLPGYMIIENLTTGAFVLSFRAAASGQVIGVEQGVTQRIYNDGTNVKFVNLQTVGSYLDICDATIPAWITACTIPPYLNCTGATFNATTYPYLNAKLGGNTLPDFRGAVPAYLNQGTGRLTNVVNGNIVGSSGGTDTVTLAATQIPAISSINNAGFNTPVASSIANICIGIGGSTTGGGGIGINVVASQGQVSSNGTVAAGNVSSASTNTGGQLHSNTQPTTVGGLRLIRAA